MNNLKNTFPKFFFLAFVLISFVFTACDDDEGMVPTEQELITTVELTFTNQADNSTVTFKFADIDGIGGNEPTVDTIKLESNSVYNMFVAFLDESNPADVEDITEEVEEENLEHLVCFGADGVSLTLDLNTDSAGDVLGTNGIFTTAQAADGNLSISLKHEPDKSAAAPCETGETDVEVMFPLVVE